MNVQQQPIRRLIGGPPVLVLALALAGCSADTPPEVVTRSSVPDAAGDVLVGGLGSAAGGVAAAPENAITDIIRTTIEHGADVVTFEVVFKDLRPGQYLDLTARVRTDGTGSRLPAQVSALAYRGKDRVDVYDSGVSRCAGAAVTVDYRANTLTMTVPRRCLDDPRWIEAEVRAATMVYDAPPDDPRANAVWEDDAYQAGHAESGPRGTSPKLHHP